MGRCSSISFPPAAPLWRPLLWGGLCLLLLAGCGRGSYVGRQYNNFTAYYNKFYNANQAFEKGLKAVRESERSVDRTRYLSIFTVSAQGNGEASFEKAIQKSADVLREHPNSKWVDDALLIIGKSYFYQQNYVGAAQKFREVLALNTARKTEARFWLARTLVTSGSYSEAAEVIRTDAVGDASRTSWAARLHLVKGELLVRQQQWEDAEVALERGLEGELPNEVAARGAFLLGQVRETREAPAEARAAYRRARRYDPPYELDFAARLREIELQGRYGNATTALERLEDLEEDDKNLENRGEIALVRARIYRAQGRNNRARSALRNALYSDRDVRLSRQTEGRLHYDLAALYRDAYKDFSRAAAHFDSASTGLQRPGGRGETEQKRLPSAPRNAQAQAEQYRSLAARAQEVARLDSLLRLGRMSDEDFQAFVKDLRRKRQAAREARAEAQRRATQSRRLGARGEALAERRPSASAAQTRDSDAGFLFHQDPTRVQQGRRQFRDTWGDRPRVDNWRRLNAMQSPQASSGETDSPRAEPGAEEAQGEVQQTASTLDLSAIPRDSASQVKMEARRAVAQYELANSLFLAAGRPDSAATWYRRILQESGDDPVARRALYALAEAYRAQGNSTAAQQTYERLIEQYPQTDLATRARERLNRSTDAQASTNFAARADSSYALAFRRWQKGEWRPALDHFLGLAREFPNTDAAPRALLASSVIYWRQLQSDLTNAPTGLLHRYLRSLNSTDSTRADSAHFRNLARLGTPNSSLVAPDTTTATATVSDSLAAAGAGTGDSTSSPADTILWASTQRTEAIRSDSSAGTSKTGTVQNPYAPLERLLSHLTEQYPDAPQVKQARSMQALIEEQRAPVDSGRADSTLQEKGPLDSTAVAAADSTSYPTGPRSDDDTTRASNDSTSKSRPRGPARTSERTPLPAPTSPASASDDKEGRRSNMKTWTVHVQSFSNVKKATDRKEMIERQVGGRWPIVVYQDPDASARPYLVGVGQFTSEKTATHVRGVLQKQQVTGGLEIRRVSDSWTRP